MTAAREATTTIELTFPRSVTSEAVTALWSGVAGALTVSSGAMTRPSFVVEVLATPGRLRHLLHATETHAPVLEQQLLSQLPGVRFEHTSDEPVSVREAIELRLSSGRRALRIDRAAEVSTAVLMALAAVKEDELLLLQWVLGGAAPARAVHAPRRVSALPSRDVEHEAGDVARELKGKVVEPQLVGVCRLGVRAKTSNRRRQLLRGALGAVRGSDSPGVRTLVRALPGACHVRRLERRILPTVWLTAMNGAELAARVPFPIGGPQVPGLALGGSRLLVPSRALSTSPDEGVVLADSTFPGASQPLVLRDGDRFQHLHVMGPPGVGKSVLLAQVAVQDIAHGHAVIVIDPRGDLIDDILNRIPDGRVDDVIVLDPADAERPVGYNPLARGGRSLDLVCDSITSVFAGLFAANWGPRTDDVLRSSLMTLGLAERNPGDGFTLCEIPGLLTDKAFRKELTAGLVDPIALEPFWAVYEGMRPAERAQVIAPLLNKLRAFLLRRSLRTMLGQSEPRWSIEGVMAERKILLVPLRSGVIGEEAAQLLGSLVVSRIWQATLGRSAIDRADRTPAMVIIDEFPMLVHSEASLGDLLAQARGHSVSMTLANQHLGQLSTEMRQDVLQNARSKVYFQQGIEDARVLARGLPELEPEDLQGLPSREVVLSLVVDAEVQPAVTGKTRPLGEPTGMADAARAHSRMTYGVDGTEAEATLLARRGTSSTKTKSAKRAPKEPPKRAHDAIGEVPEEDES